jgi:DnaJ-class molecular chaperone
MSKSHYETLGVSKDSEQAEIKKKYRELSLRYHPDRNNSSDAKQKFQEISSAYEELSDPEKRRQYDAEQSGMHFGGGFPGGFPPGFPGGAHFTHMSSMDGHDDINEIFNMMFSGMGGGFPGMGGGMGSGIPGMPGVRIFHGGNMFQQMQKPPAIIKNIKISMEQSYQGANIPIEIERWTQNGDLKISENETIYLAIPAGIDNGEIMILRDQGHSINSEIKGDVKLVIQVENTTPFMRQGLDLIFKKTISLKESLCGFTFEIPHLNGKTLCLNNHTNHTIIKPNFKKVIPTMGVARENNVGNLIIEFDVEFPDALSQEQIDLLKKAFP